MQSSALRPKSCAGTLHPAELATMTEQEVEEAVQENLRQSSPLTDSAVPPPPPSALVGS